MKRISEIEKEFDENMVQFPWNQGQNCTFHSMSISREKFKNFLQIQHKSLKLTQNKIYIFVPKPDSKSHSQGICSHLPTTPRVCPACSRSMQQLPFSPNPPENPTFIMSPLSRLTCTHSQLLDIFTPQRNSTSLRGVGGCQPMGVACGTPQTSLGHMAHNIGITYYICSND